MFIILYNYIFTYITIKKLSFSRHGASKVDHEKPLLERKKMLRYE